MEKDKQTRVFMTGTNPGSGAWERHPEKVPHDKRLLGNEAGGVMGRVDYHAVNSKTEWIVYPKPEGDNFSVAKSGDTAGRHADLARQLEQISGKTGLTITTI